MTFQKESDFEEALIKILTTKGWESTILKYPTEQDLIRNWALLSRVCDKIRQFTQRCQ